MESNAVRRCMQSAAKDFGRREVHIHQSCIDVHADINIYNHIYIICMYKGFKVQGFEPCTLDPAPWTLDPQP